MLARSRRIGFSTAAGSRMLRVLLTALFASILVMGPGGIAHADEKTPDGWNQDDWKRYQALAEDKKKEIQGGVIHDLAADKCGDWAYSSALAIGGDCESFTRGALLKAMPTPAEAVGEKGWAMSWCEALKQNGGNAVVQKQCEIGAITMAIGIVTNLASKKANEVFASLPVVGEVIKTVQFIADPKSAWDNMANDMKSQSVDATKEVLTKVSSVTSFDPNSKEFRSLWAASAGIGVVVFVVMLMMLFKRYGNGEISSDSFVNSMMYYIPLGFLAVIFGAPMMGWLQGQADALTDGTGTWAAGAINNFMETIASFAAMESTPYFGSLGAIVLFGLLWLGAIGLLFFLLLTPYFGALGGVAFAVLFGLMLDPRLRPRVVKIAGVILTAIFMHPIIFFAIGAVFTVMGSAPAFKEGTDDALVTLGTLGATVILMGMLALSPAVIFKFLPMLDAQDQSRAGAAPAIAAGAAAVGFGAVAARAAAGGFNGVRQAAASRRRAMVDSHSGGSGHKSGGGDVALHAGSAPSGAVGATSAGSPKGGSGSGRTASSPKSGVATGGGGGSSGTGRRVARMDAGRTNAASPWTEKDRHGNPSRDQQRADAVRAGASGRRSSGAGSQEPGPRSGRALPSAPITTGLVGSLWAASQQAGQSATRAARRAAAEDVNMPQTSEDFRGTPIQNRQD